MAKEYCPETNGLNNPITDSNSFPVCIVILYPYKVCSASFTYICISLFHAELYLDLLKIAKKVSEFKVEKRKKKTLKMDFRVL